MEKNKAKDPVCGMEVDTNSEFHAVHAGKEYYFCSQADKEEFQKHAAKYLHKQAEKVTSGNPTKW